MLISSIIPAHNEESKILTTISEYFHNDTLINGYELIVICNGCTDKTADIVKSISNQIQIIELAEGSKIKAINTGVASCSGDFVFVQDADVVIDTNSLCNIYNFALNNNTHLASPIAEYTISDSTWCVQRYYEFLFKTNAFKFGMVGTGCYLINMEMSHSVFPIPNLIADDGYVKSVLGSKYKNITTAIAKVDSPKDLFSLIKIKTRSRRGNIQLSALSIKQRTASKNSSLSIFKLLAHKENILGFIIYIFVVFISIARAKIQIITNNNRWERDDSSRI